MEAMGGAKIRQGGFGCYSSVFGLAGRRFGSVKAGFGALPQHGLFPRPRQQGAQSSDRCFDRARRQVAGA
jgi:hypothetical protein